jgi:NADH-quinone oxidoreductase subunit G
MAYGEDETRFNKDKRLVDNKYMGPLIKTIMTRCIHCTRCVRFSTEIAGVSDLGLLGRGENAEISTYLEKAIASELSGNVIDLCPVGALTSRPYAFVARPWELNKTESVDVMDAVGSNIRIDARGREVMRILPRLHEDINEEWISDKTRYVWDGLKRQRLDQPYVRVDGKLRPATWDEALSVVAQRLKGVDGNKIAAIAGDMACSESLFALKGLMDSLGSPNLDCRQNGAQIGGGERSSYLFNTTIAGIEEADAILLVGTNPRVEAPLVNARIRKRWIEGGLKVASVGPNTDLTYEVDTLGAGPETLTRLAEGNDDFNKVLSEAANPMVIIGQGALTRADGPAILATVAKIASQAGVVKEGWNGFNILHTAASAVAGLDLGFLPAQGGKATRDILTGVSCGDIEVVYLLGADEIDTSALEKAFVIYQGSHGDAGAHAADVIFPGSAYTEKNALWVNMEGRVQSGRRAVFPPGDAKEDWSILRALSALVGKTLPYNNLEQLRAALFAQHEHFGQLDTVATGASLDLNALGKSGEMDGTAFQLPIQDFYLTNPIARASNTMAECSALFVHGQSQEATGTDG